MKEERTGRQTSFREVAYTDEQREEMKHQHMIDAEAWEPPTHFQQEYYLKPGEVTASGFILDEVIVWLDPTPGFNSFHNKP